MARHGVIIAVLSPAETRVVEAIDAHRTLEVVRRCADLAEAAGAASAGLGSAVVVSDQPHLTRAVLADFFALGIAVVGVPSTPESAEQLRILGIEAIVAPHAADLEIVTAIETEITRVHALTASQVWNRKSSTDARERLGSAHFATIAAQPAPTDRSAGELIAVWGPTGAPGRTTVAVNLAAEFSAGGARVLLVDADTYGGAVAQACGLTDEAPGLAALARTAQHGAIETHDVARHALMLAPGLYVLTGVTRAERWSELPSIALGEVWRAARAWADVTVVDCGFSLESDEDLTYDTRAPQRNGATLSALAAATRVVAVGSAEPLGIQRLVHSLPALAELSSVEPVVVVNRVRPTVAGPRPEEAVADALLRFASVERAWTLPWDPHACDAATLAGQTLVERAPRSKLRRAMGSFARALNVVADTPPSRSTRVVHAGVGD